MAEIDAPTVADVGDVGDVGAPMPAEDGGIKGFFERLPWWGWLVLAVILLALIYFLFLKPSSGVQPVIGPAFPPSGGGGGGGGDAGGPTPPALPATNADWINQNAPALASSLGMSVADVSYFLNEWLQGNNLGSAYYNKVVSAAQQLGSAPPSLPSPTAGAFTTVGQWWANAQMFLNEAGLTATQAQMLNNLVNNPASGYVGDANAAGLQAALASLEQWVGYIPVDTSAWFTAPPSPSPSPSPSPTPLNLFNASNINLIPGGSTARDRIPVLQSWFPDLSAGQVSQLSTLFHVWGGGNNANGITNPFNGWSQQQIIDFVNGWLSQVRAGTAQQLITQYQQQFNYYA